MYMYDAMFDNQIEKYQFHVAAQDEQSLSRKEPLEDAGALDSMIGSYLKPFIFVGLDRSSFVCYLVHRGSTDDYLLQISRSVVQQSRDFQLSRNTLYILSPRLCCYIVLTRRIKSLDPLKAKKIFIRKAEDGPYLGFGYQSLISDPMRSGKRSQRKIL